MDPSLARFALTAGLALLLTAPASAQTSKGLAALGSEALPGPLPAASMAAVDGWPARPHVQARPLDGSPADKIVNGVALSGFPSVGLLLNGPSPSVCTGTLIGCSTFLTAAHCVVGDSTRPPTRRTSNTAASTPSRASPCIPATRTPPAAHTIWQSSA